MHFSDFFQVPLPYFNLTLIGIFKLITHPGPYRAMTCRERELTMDHIHTFLTTQGHRGPPQMSNQLNSGATSEKTRTLKTIGSTHHSLTHSFWQGGDEKDDYVGQMILGDLVGLNLPDISLTGEEKTSPRKLVPTGNRTRARCVTRTHYRLLGSDWLSDLLQITIGFSS